MDSDALRLAIDKVGHLSNLYSKKGLTEQDTKNALIEPVLDALGWPKTDLDRVRSEYRHISNEDPVDYTLLSSGRPVMFVEAKALDVPIDDYKAIRQVLDYANRANVAWALLTNGRKWTLYSAFARVEAQQKQFFSIQIHDPDAQEWLKWLP